MAIIDEIKRMQSEGKSDQDITLLLQEEGYGIKEVSDTIAQTNIKKAVTGTTTQNDESMTSTYSLDQTQGLQQSMISETPTEEEAPRQSNQNQGYQQQQPYLPQQQEQYQQDYGQGYQQQYPSYDPASASNSDVVTDIAEQIVTEKLMDIRKQLEITIEMKSTIDSKLLAMDDRLKRIEKVIDRLQLSILQKVGEYMTNVDDIKKEMIETQRSFKSLLDDKK